MVRSNHTPGVSIAITSRRRRDLSLPLLLRIGQEANKSRENKTISITYTWHIWCDDILQSDHHNNSNQGYDNTVCDDAMCENTNVLLRCSYVWRYDMKVCNLIYNDIRSNANRLCWEKIITMLGRHAKNCRSEVDASGFLFTLCWLRDLMKTHGKLSSFEPQRKCATAGC